MFSCKLLKLRIFVVQLVATVGQGKSLAHCSVVHCNKEGAMYVITQLMYKNVMVVLIAKHNDILKHNVPGLNRSESSAESGSASLPFDCRNIAITASFSLSASSGTGWSTNPMYLSSFRSLFISLVTSVLTRTSFCTSVQTWPAQQAAVSKSVQK
jgi:hypothetical protein